MNKELRRFPSKKVAFDLITHQTSISSPEKSSSCIYLKLTQCELLPKGYLQPENQMTPEPFGFGAHSFTTMTANLFLRKQKTAAIKNNETVETGIVETFHNFVCFCLNSLEYLFLNLHHYIDFLSTLYWIITDWQLRSLLLCTTLSWSKKNW